MTLSLRQRGVQVVLLDVEGTTTPISFVYDVLFPYARRQMRSFLRAHAERDSLDDVAGLLRAESSARAMAGENVPQWREGDSSELQESIASLCEWLMDRDVKSPGLKLLQGKIWQLGYSDGSIKGDVFPDVPAALERWTRAGIRVAIYSSGSVLAQQLIFRHAPAPFGDLTGKISAYFDTAVGPKKDPASYSRIAGLLGVPPGLILFISDVGAELDAAAAAGFQVMLAVRPPVGNQPIERDPTREVVSDFNQLA